MKVLARGRGARPRQTAAARSDGEGEGKGVRQEGESANDLLDGGGEGREGRENGAAEEARSMGMEGEMRVMGVEEEEIVLDLGAWRGGTRVSSRGSTPRAGAVVLETILSASSESDSSEWEGEREGGRKGDLPAADTGDLREEGEVTKSNGGKAAREDEVERESGLTNDILGDHNRQEDGVGRASSWVPLLGDLADEMDDVRQRRDAGETAESALAGGDVRVNGDEGIEGWCQERRAWEREREERGMEGKAWRMEREAWERERQTWDREREERGVMKKAWRVEREAWERERQAWAKDRDAFEQERCERTAEERVAKELKECAREQERERERGERERERERERDEGAREKEEWERERAEYLLQIEALTTLVDAEARDKDKEVGRRKLAEAECSQVTSVVREGWRVQHTHTHTHTYTRTHTDASRYGCRTRTPPGDYCEYAGGRGRGAAGVGEGEGGDVGAGEREFRAVAGGQRENCGAGQGGEHARAALV